MRLKFCHLLPVWAVSALILFLSVAASAQSLMPLGVRDSAPQSDVSKIIEQAAESGVGVIVIDSQGNMLSPIPEEAPAPAETDEKTGSALMKAQEDANAFRNALFERLTQLPAAVNEVLFILRASSPTGEIFVYFEVLIWSLVLFAIGMVAERQIYGKRIAKHFVMPLIRENPQGYSEKMPFLVVRFVAGVIGILFAITVAYIVGLILFGSIDDSAVQYTATLINIGYFSARFVTGLWRMILSPFLAQYRIPRLSDRDAKRLYYWLVIVVIAAFFTMIFAEWVRELGLNDEVYVFLLSFNSFWVTVLNIVLVMANRRAITMAILGDETRQTASVPVRFLAGSWALVAVTYLIFAWGELVYDLVLGFDPGVPLSAGAYAILTVMLVVYGVINFTIETSFARARALRALNAAEDEDESDGEYSELEEPPLQHKQITTFEELARRVAGILAFVAGLWAFVNLWNPETAMMQETLYERLLQIVVYIFIGYIIYSVFRIWIDNKIREEQGDQEPAELGDEGGGSSASRLATLLPLFRNFILIVIVVSVALIVLMELGVNVGPLFAGAGIVGVAVGFGSQTLVRDIFSGAFFLFDDAFRKGEYIEIGEVRGTVEKISVRSFQLRHHLGKLHTIPFGEIQVLTNYSRDWVMMKLPLRVTYDTDVERVRKLIKKLGQRLLEDPVIGQDFIQPLKSQGVIEMQDSAMIIRVKFMTKPGDQWVIRKRVFQEIRDLFEKEGIKFAHREVTVRLADSDQAKDLSHDQKEAVLAAAEASIEEDIMEERGDDR